MLFNLLFYQAFAPNVGFILGILAAVYGGLLLLQHRITQKNLHLTDEEVAQYGETLEKVTPTIIEMLKQRRRIKHIANTLQHSDGLPHDITCRYIIALLKQMQANQQLQANHDAPGK